MIISSFFRMTKHPELLILLLMVIIIAMLIIPMPTPLMDMLIAINIIIAALVFLSSFYIDRIISFSSFPAVLLITTLFRLALSISTTRLILTNADAGEIISSFGDFVIGENLIVGFVIFAIVTIVQFMVITKGSERVAEVAARFSLDGMPGKQMSIDADLKNGAIDNDEAKARRALLEKESQLYGSFDGAMKFIKGDAIACIIVIFINLIGGVSVGVTQHGMDMSTALHTYTQLTIGDGLVAQIPSLLIAISAGLIVTRVSGEGNNMGQTMVGQLFGNSFVLIIAAAIAIGIGTLPGFPFITFLILAAALTGLCWIRYRAQAMTAAQAGVSEAGNAVSTPTEPAGPGVVSNLMGGASDAVPLILLVAEDLHLQLEQAGAARSFCNQFFIDYGIKLPEIILRKVDTLQSGEAVLLINEIRSDSYSVCCNRLRVINGSDELVSLGLDLEQHKNGYWVSEQHSSMLAELGFQLRPALDDLYCALAASLVLNTGEFFGIQETKNMMDELEDKYPDLIKEVLRHATVQRICEVLQRLLAERISVRNMKLILEALATWAPREKDVINLVEHVRGALSRYISHKFSVNNNLRVIMLSSETEDKLRQGIRNTSSGAFLNLEPAVADELVDRFSLIIDPLAYAHTDMVILSSVDIRRFAKVFVSSRYKSLEVISYSEVAESVSLDVINSI